MKQLSLATAFLVLSFTTVRAQSYPYRNLVMEGGGVRGFAYAGAMQVLDSLQILPGIERVGGTSAGAIQATLLAVGYTPEEMMQVVKEIPLKQFNDGGWFFLGGFRRLRKEFGWYKGDRIQQWMEQLIAAKTGDGNITFAELHNQRPEKGYKDLYITGTDLTWQCLTVFSYESFPAMRIKDAVRISLSIPVYYKAVLMDDAGRIYKNPADTTHLHVMADGGVLGNYPLFLFDSTKYLSQPPATVNRVIENPETLGLLMEMPEQMTWNRQQKGNGPIDITSMRQYWKALYRTLVDKANPDGNGKYSLKRSIAISNLNLSGRVRRLPSATIYQLMESGREGVRMFFNVSEKASGK